MNDGHLNDNFLHRFVHRFVMRQERVDVVLLVVSAGEGEAEEVLRYGCFG